jgi:hypothetical protein
VATGPRVTPGLGPPRHRPGLTRRIGPRFQYYWRKLPLTEVPFGRTWFDRRDALGLALGEAGDPRARSVLQRIVARDPDPAKREGAARLLAALDGPRSSRGP